MKRLLFLATLLCIWMTATAQTQQLFDDDWQFTHDGKTAMVSLPHDWDISYAPDPATGATGTDGGWFPGGKGEYRKTFATPKGEIVKLHFEGVYQRAEVFVNGQKAGQHAYGYTPFTVDVTPYLHKDKRQNEVLVTVDNSQQKNCRWYAGSGIYRHVWLQAMPALHIAENGVFVTTPEVSEQQAVVNIEVTVQNEGNSERKAVVVIDDSHRQSIVLKAGERKTMTFSKNIDNPKLWSPDTPHMYKTEVELFTERGTLLAHTSVPFGIRTFSYDAENGFRLNGKPLLLNGGCVHHDNGIIGAMTFDDAEIRKVRLMKEAGFNLLRTSHNPASRAFLDACDSLGMLVIAEAFDGWRKSKTPYDYSTLIDSCYREDIHAMVLRDRNHPGIISWSIGNEVIERKDIAVVTTARKLKARYCRLQLSDA